MGLKYSDNVFQNAPSYSRAITQLASTTADGGLGAGYKAHGAAGGEVSDSVIDAFPSDTALRKELQQGKRWKQAESEKDQPFEGKCMVKGCIQPRLGLPSSSVEGWQLY